MFVSGPGSWDVGLVTPALDLPFGSWACSPASFLNGNYVRSWTWKLENWTCHLSIGLVFWKLGLQPSFIRNRKLCLFLDVGLVTPASDLSFGSWAEEVMFVSGLGSWGIGLVTPALDLSFGSWACGPASFFSFLMGNYVCFWTCMFQHWTCHCNVGLVMLPGPASFLISN